MISTSFPSFGSVYRSPLSSTGSLQARFPGFAGTMELYDSLPPVPRAPLPLPSVTACAPRNFALTASGRPWPRAWIFGKPEPSPASSSAEAIGPPRFLGEPSWVYAVLSDPGRAPHARPLRHGSAVAPQFNKDDPDDVIAFVAPSHGLNPRCLRFAGALTEYAHARLACGRWPTSTAQDSHLPGPLRKVSALSATAYIASPFPRLILAP